MRWFVSNLILLSIVFGASFGLDKDETECRRFSIQEFYASVFDPLMSARVELLESALDRSVQAVEEILVGLEERKKSGQDVNGVKSGIERSRQTVLLSLHKAKFSTEEVWSVALASNPTHAELKTHLLDILEALKNSEEDLGQSFNQVTGLAQSVVNTMVKVLKEGILKKFGENLEEQKTQLVESFKNRGKPLGIAMGQLVLAELEDQKIPKYQFLASPTQAVEDLIKAFESSQDLDNFWPEYLKTKWSAKEEASNLDSDAEFVQLLAALFHNSENTSYIFK